MAGTSTTTVAVDIFGATYQVRGDDDTSHLRQLAALVDHKMREVAGRSSSVDPNPRSHNSTSSHPQQLIV